MRKVLIIIFLFIILFVNIFDNTMSARNSKSNSDFKDDIIQGIITEDDTNVSNIQDTELIINELNGPPGCKISTFFIDSHNNYWIATEQKHIFLSKNRGKKWIQINGDYITYEIKIIGEVDNEIYVDSVSNSADAIYHNIYRVNLRNKSYKITDLDGLEWQELLKELQQSYNDEYITWDKFYYSFRYADPYSKKGFSYIKLKNLLKYYNNGNIEFPTRQWVNIIRKNLTIKLISYFGEEVFSDFGDSVFKQYIDMDKTPIVVYKNGGSIYIYYPERILKIYRKKIKEIRLSHINESEVRQIISLDNGYKYFLSGNANIWIYRKNRWKKIFNGNKKIFHIDVIRRINPAYDNKLYFCFNGKIYIIYKSKVSKLKIKNNPDSYFLYAAKDLKNNIYAVSRTSVEYEYRTFSLGKINKNKKYITIKEYNTYSVFSMCSSYSAELNKKLNKNIIIPKIFSIKNGNIYIIYNGDYTKIGKGNSSITNLLSPDKSFLFFDVINNISVTDRYEQRIINELYEYNTQDTVNYGGIAPVYKVDILNLADIGVSKIIKKYIMSGILSLEYDKKIGILFGTLNGGVFSIKHKK